MIHFLTVLLFVVLLVVVVLLVIVILLQRSEGGVLSGLGGGAAQFLAPRGQGNVLTRATIILAILMVLCIIGLNSLMGHRRTSTLIKNIESQKVQTTQAANPETPPKKGTTS